jgi:flavin-dependent dehydrogenase
VAKEPLISIKTNFRIDDFEKHLDGWKLSNKLTMESVHANLVVAADGAQSRFAKIVGGIHMEEHHFSAGLRAYYKGVKGLNPDGFIELHFLKEFLPGYFWIFPLANGCANVGVGVPSSVVREKHLNLKLEMLKLIQTNPTIMERFENAELVDDIKGYGLPLGSKKRPISGDGFLLLGDAASLIYPFTGEGLGNAMISALKASEVIAANYSSADYAAKSLAKYDEIVYNRLWPELNLSSKMLQLVKYPWLFNLVINKASRSKTLQETISCMFEDIDMRSKLKDPRFYLKILLE